MSETDKHFALHQTDSGICPACGENLGVTGLEKWRMIHQEYEKFLADNPSLNLHSSSMWIAWHAAFLIGEKYGRGLD
jgi:hypothetical protein